MRNERNNILILDNVAITPNKKPDDKSNEFNIIKNDIANDISSYGEADIENNFEFK